MDKIKYVRVIPRLDEFDISLLQEPFYLSSICVRNPEGWRL
jgi:hypothetical protein